ncbi:MAG TPA: hypothetical protein VF702_13765 [Allosphingosinicella sp.]|jgi:hypothetical protein
MDDSPPRFEPVPLRARRDGWTADQQRAFIRFIHLGLKPGPAAARLGLRRQGAYELRARPGGEGFAAAWDAAADAARRRRIAARSGAGLYKRAVEGIAYPIRYRRCVVAVERQYDNRALIRLLAMLDRHVPKTMNRDPGLNSSGDAVPLSASASAARCPPGVSTPAAASRRIFRRGKSPAHPLEGGQSPDRPE